MHQAAGVIDPQTEADRSCQRCIISSLQNHFPKVHIFGEEVTALLIHPYIMHVHHESKTANWFEVSGKTPCARTD